MKQSVIDSINSAAEIATQNAVATTLS